MFRVVFRAQEAAVATTESILDDTDVGAAFPDDLNRMLSTVLGFAD
jgi:hypothetical protein